MDAFGVFGNDNHCKNKYLNQKSAKSNIPAVVKVAFLQYSTSYHVKNASVNIVLFLLKLLKYVP